jgi:hypothetical protein
VETYLVPAETYLPPSYHWNKLSCATIKFLMRLNIARRNTPFRHFSEKLHAEILHPPYKGGGEFGGVSGVSVETAGLK